MESAEPRDYGLNRVVHCDRFGEIDGQRSRDAPTTVAPVSRNRRVIKDPRPPFAPVMKTTFSFMSVRDFSTF
jgi:hypothetical protein